MPWGHPHDFICVECGETFSSLAINPQRCPACREVHNRERRLQHYREKRGERFGQRAKSKPLTEMARFNMLMVAVARTAKCPICGLHMTKCKCCDPQLNTIAPVVVETWRPIELPIPKER